MEYSQIIVDTNVFINKHQRKKDKKNSKLTQLVKNYIVTTAITVYELFAGVVTLRHEEDIKNLLFGVEVLQLDKESAEILAKERLRLLKQNRQFKIRDILVAGIVIKNQLPLATFNVKHFVDFRDIELVSMEDL